MSASPSVHRNHGQVLYPEHKPAQNSNVDSHPEDKPVPSLKGRITSIDDEPVRYGVGCFGYIINDGIHY